MNRLLQDLVDRIKSSTMKPVEVRTLLHHQSPLVRVNALEALVDAARHDEGILEELFAATTDPRNSIPLMGTVSIAHVGVACLLRVGTTRALEAVKALLTSWQEPDRTDLTWYLRSEGLDIDDRTRSPG